MTLETSKPEVIVRPDDANSNYTDAVSKASKLKGWALSFVGIFIVLIAVGIMFIIASLEGTREIHASRNLGGKILQNWRVANDLGPNTYPEEMVERFVYNGKEYYFVVEEYDDSFVPVKWYFAYEGEMKYVFGDWKFWALNVIALGLSIYIASTMFRSGVSSSQKSDKFKASQKYYSECKKRVENDTQYLSQYCSDKYEETYNDAVERIVKQAGIKYEDYKANEYVAEKWQKKILKLIRKIRIEGISNADLLQDKVRRSQTKISLLPIDQARFERNYIIKTSLAKSFSIVASGLTVVFGFTIGNWQVGLSYAFIILSTAFSSYLVGIDYGMNELRLRFIGKGDLLIEFANAKQKYIDIAKRIADELKRKEELAKAVTPAQKAVDVSKQIATSITIDPLRPLLDNKDSSENERPQTSYYQIP